MGRLLCCELPDFWSNIVVVESCWEWTGYADPKGYGRVNRNRRSRVAHRYVYESIVGPVPEGLVLDHLCRNRRCVNPAHLEPVTNRENILRGVGASAKNIRKTHCKNGHAYDEANTHWYANGTKRMCRTCNREQTARYHASIRCGRTR